MLKTIRVQNFRSCEDTRFRPHPQLSVLIGPNASGKTSVLQALRLLARLTQRPTVRDDLPTRRGAETRTTVSASFGDGTFPETRMRCTMAIEPERSNHDRITGSQVDWRVAATEHSTPFAARVQPSVLLDSRAIRPFRIALKQRNGAALREDFYRESLRRGFIPSEYAEGHSAEFKAISNVAAFCAGIKYYGASQFTSPADAPASFEVAEESESYRPPLKNHARLLYEMYEHSIRRDPATWERYLDLVGTNGLRLVNKIHFRVIRFSSVDYGVGTGGKPIRRPSHRSLVIPTFWIGRKRLSPSQLSEGTFKTLALVFHLVADRSRAVLIEEPEVCVHHGLLSSIVELIKGQSSEKQIFVSTHSDYVLDQIHPENVFLTSWTPKNGTGVTSIRSALSRDSFRELRRFLATEGNLGEYWRERGLELGS